MAAMHLMNDELLQKRWHCVFVFNSRYRDGLALLKADKNGLDDG